MTQVPRRPSALVGAEWSSGVLYERTTLVELTQTSGFVVTETFPAIGARIELALSFASTHAEIVARTTHVRLSDNPNLQSGFGVAFDVDADGAQELARLVRATTLRGAAARRPVRMLHVEPRQLLRDMFAYAIDRYFASRAVRPTLVSASSLAEIDAAAEPIEVVIVDHDVTRAGGGAEVVRHLRANQGVDAWILGVGVGGAPMRDRMFDAGVDAYVQKPIALTDVLCSIELVMQRQEELDALGAA